MRKGIIGIDGGATKTELIVTDDAGNTVLFEKGDPSNICASGKEQAARALKELIEKSRHRLPGDMEITAVGIGAAGLLTEEDAQFYRAVLSNATNCSRIIAVNDSVSAIYADFGDSAGISLTAGTGSICMGKDTNGNIIRAGGWGHLFSDEGSAYDIAVEGLRRCIAAYEGRGMKTALVSLLEERTNCSGIDNVVAELYRHSEKEQIAGFAEAVDAAASTGDAVATEVLLCAASRLVTLADYVATRLELGRQSFTVAVTGSVLMKNNTVYNEFCRIFTQKFPKAIVTRSHKNACFGAAYLAARLLHHSIPL